MADSYLDEHLFKPTHLMANQPIWFDPARKLHNVARTFLAPLSKGNLEFRPMEFRWVALMALWTILSGPIFGGPSGKASRAKDRPPVVTTAKQHVHQENTRQR
jgi:hypothetical protein